MTEKKNSKYTIEELLAKVAEGSKPRRRIENNSNVLRYMEEFQFEPGLQAVPNYVIYHHYRTKFICDKKYKANKIVFFRTFGKKFKSHRWGKQRFYLMKEGVFDLSKENLEEAKFYDKKYVRFKKEEGREKEPDEISSNSSGDESSQD